MGNVRNRPEAFLSFTVSRYHFSPFQNVSISDDYHIEAVCLAQSSVMSPHVWLIMLLLVLQDLLIPSP